MFAAMMDEASGPKRSAKQQAHADKMRRRRVVAAATVVGALVAYKAGIRSRRLAGAIRQFESASPVISKAAPIGKLAKLQRRLARGAGVPARDVRGVAQYLPYSADYQKATGFRAGISPVGKAAQEQISTLQGATRRGRYRGKVKLGGPVTDQSMIGIGRMDFNPLTGRWSRMKKGVRRGSLKHEIGHNVWMGLSPSARIHLGPQAQRTYVSKKFQYARPGVYAFGQRGSEGFAEIYRTHRGVSSRAFRRRHGRLRAALARKERRILAEALWRSRRG
jgi:hypothetical protein